MQGIASVNASVAKKFAKGVDEVITVCAKKVSPEELKYAGVRLVCEDARLSFPSFGKEYQAIDLKRCKGVEALNEEEFNFYLDVCAAVLDVENMWPSTPSDNKVKLQILAGEGFKKGRAALLSCLQAVFVGEDK